MNLVNQMKNYMDSDNHDFKIFKLNYTNEEIQCIEKFNILKYDVYRYIGHKNNMKNMNKFLNELGNNSKESVNILEKTIIKILNTVLSAFETNYYWIDIRATLPNNDYNIPRWHKDGKYFIHSKKQSPKFATVLKGPGTLLIKNTKKVSKIYNDIDIKEYNDMMNLSKTIEEKKILTEKYRKIYVKAFKKMKIYQTQNNEGVIWYSGINIWINEKGLNEGALHSEPKMTSQRLFISILPGSKEEIHEMKKSF